MDIVKKVTIKNFRSIERQEFEPANLTLFVGQNDSGKSNFLRALNLFFNDQTDPGQGLVFSTDFSSHAIVGRGKAKQIEVWIDIEPPQSFKDRTVVRWRRAWREGGSTFAWQDIKRLGDGKELSGRSKVYPWLARIRYKYVPAIKGSDYFFMLLRDVHDVLAETVDQELRSASTEFIQAIRGHTSQISMLTSSALGMESKLRLPTDLRALFEVLDFETSSNNGPKSLKQRGDGIKVRHISAILKFLSDQEKKLAGSGRSRPSTIWGYEEPENNLELSRAFDHAEELLQFSNDIQILISTHSPAFYSLLSKKDSVKGYSVIPTVKGTVLSEIGSKDVADLDHKLGLMTLVAPYISDKAEELKAARLAFDDLSAQLAKHNQKLAILVAGKTDAQYLNTAIDCLAPELTKKVVVHHVGISDSGGSTGGGDSNLLRFANELSLKPDLHVGQILVLLDCDVKELPKSNSGKLRFKKLPFNSSNAKFKRGIENMLPSCLALPEFYRKDTKEDEYGGNVIFTKLDKMKLCTAVCDKNSSLPIEWKQRFVEFQCLVDYANEQLSSVTQN